MPTKCNVTRIAITTMASMSMAKTLVGNLLLIDGIYVFTSPPVVSVGRGNVEAGLLAPALLWLVCILVDT